MSVIEGMLRDEKKRNMEMQARYEQELAKLPKGSISKRKIGNGIYYYLKYREGSRTKTDYLGKRSTRIDQLEMLIKKRKEFERIIRELKSEYKIISKVVKE